jgi:hypothetical protein
VQLHPRSPRAHAEQSARQLSKALVGRSRPNDRGSLSLIASRRSWVSAAQTLLSSTQPPKAPAVCPTRRLRVVRVGQPWCPRHDRAHARQPLAQARSPAVAYADAVAQAAAPRAVEVDDNGRQRKAPSVPKEASSDTGPLPGLHRVVFSGSESFEPPQEAGTTRFTGRQAACRQQTPSTGGPLQVSE